MYFKDKNNTNIDDDFDNNNLFSNVIKIISKYKIFIIIGIIILVVGIVIFFSLNKNNVNYLYLNGDEEITLYVGTDYIEPGYDAYDSKERDLTDKVIITSTLDTLKIGEYEIVYSLGNVEKVRRVNVIAKSEEYVYIKLNAINNDVNIYLNVGDEYIEPGYKVYSSSDEDLTNQVKVSGEVDTSKTGSYRFVYTVVDGNGITASTSRMVYVLDTEINLSLNNNNYTNDKVVINVKVIDDFFDYMILPNGDKITKNIYSYEVSQNGEYIFKTYNKKGIEKEKTIKVNNIDKTLPTGTCMVNQNENGYYIKVDATDTSGIKKYEYGGKTYSNNVIKISNYVDNAKVVVYDNANNKKEISCKAVALPVITNITNDGVIVKINSKKVSSNISGYYFSYTNKRPSKTSGGYLATSKESLEVVRLPGTTYVWVEDSSGKISNYGKITLGNEVLPTTKNKYTVLKGTRLDTYLKNNGWSIEEFNKLIARSVRAAGLYTKEGAATAAVSLELVLIQKYKIKLPYWMGGKTRSIGALGSWGMYRENPTFEGYNYYGMDCDGLVNWSYYNAGVEYSSILNDSYYFWSGIEYSKENGNVGDVLRRSGHVAIIIGKNDNGFIVAEAYGEAVGMIINTYPYTDKSGYTIIKGERLFENYQKFSSSNYPSGF